MQLLIHIFEAFIYLGGKNGCVVFLFYIIYVINNNNLLKLYELRNIIK